jgi:hypothetical protein
LTRRLELKQRLGSGEFTHQHSPTVLDNGNILVFDNGFHELYAPNVMSRVLEIHPKSGKIVWSFGGGDEKQLFYSSMMSSCQRLPNENTFICEGTWGRLFEVNPNGELVWEYVNNLPSYETSPIKSKSCPVYCAYRYGMDYSGLKRSAAVPERRQAAPGTVSKEEEALKSRITSLGY